ncbi:uncharacterized protein LOC106873274 [Octopus bimaculoides]|uniref:uncharacterized protein LOC106873274 n=1 Tax=Octopus bimaculoides TaxID=37653 RepID=UPI00071CBDC0|nr:uncharacterized protein LOC106873274 [Octopus bimaculoides]|eukprot:XP_014776054.1 PREDICTED: uncharacterized protein LOC106873274 [Octopus bimaculoides]
MAYKIPRKHALHNIKMRGEMSSADKTAAEEFLPKLAKIIEEVGYISDQVFNADETGLFWEKMPNRTYIAKSEKSASDFKAAKDRIGREGFEELTIENIAELTIDEAHNEEQIIESISENVYDSTIWDARILMDGRETECDIPQRTVLVWKELERYNADITKEEQCRTLRDLNHYAEFENRISEELQQEPPPSSQESPSSLKNIGLT